MKKISIFLFILFALCFAQEGARYLIITHDNFYSAIQPLAEWKNKKGMKTKIARLSETGSTNNQIRNYIINAYNTWNPRPEFILLVGSADYLPSFFRNVYPYSYDTDNEYANMTGDYVAELRYGRFPAKTLAQCSVMVAKTLNYERTPFLGDTLWFKSGTVIVNQDNDPDDTIYWNNAKFAASQMIANGYTKIDTLSDLYLHSATNVVNAVTQGRTFVLYRGSGVGNWYTPFAVNPALTNNGNKLPVICSFTCATMTLAPLESMVGDAWIKAGNTSSLKGAVAFVGNTHSGTNIAPVRSAITRGFFKSAFQESTMYLGQAVLDGKKQIYTEFANQYEYEGFNLLGDPELCLWTAKPKTLVVSHDSFIPVAPQNFLVTVRREGIALPNALVCVKKDSEVYEYGYTNSAGQISLAINPITVGTMAVTVTAQNCLPYEVDAQVVPASGPYVVYQGHIINDPSPGGNGDNNLNPGESITFVMGLKNIGNETARNVWARLRSTESEVTIWDSLKYYGDILPDSVVFQQPGFGFSVSPACTNQQHLNFTIFIQDDVRNYTQGFELIVNAGRLVYQTYDILDPIPGGNNNSRLDPGESGKLTLTFENSGQGDFVDVQVKLRSNDRYLLITDSTGHFGRFYPGESKTNSSDPFALSVSPQAFSGYRALVRVVKYAFGETYQFIDSITLFLTIGQAGQNVPTGPDEYGYFVYDNTDLNSGQAPTYNWMEISLVGQTIPEITDANNSVATMTLPFSFRYYGQNYDSISASSNGYLVMGQTTFNSGDNTSIFNSCPNMIAPFWDDLDMRRHQSGYGEAYRYYDATNHRYIIEYREAAHYGQRLIRETFEVIFLDPAYYPTPTGDGEIIFQYQTVADASSNTVGFCDQTQSRGLELLYNNEYDPSVAGLYTGRAFRITTVAPQSVSAPWLSLISLTVNDSLGNSNGLPEPGEMIILNLVLKNFGGVSANDVQSVLRNQDNDALVLDSTANFGNIEPNASSANSTPYRFQIAENPNDSIADFALIVDANNGSYQTVIYFTLDLYGVIGIKENAKLEIQNSKLQCLPNPFNRSTVIRWQLPNSNFEFRIYNTMGRLVMSHKPRVFSDYFIWNGKDRNGKLVPKGLYFLILTDNKKQVIINQKLIRVE